MEGTKKRQPFHILQVSLRRLRVSHKENALNRCTFLSLWLGTKKSSQHSVVNRDIFVF